jgi:hypothetical protein
MPNRYNLGSAAYRFPDLDLFGASGLFYVFLLTLVFMSLAYYSATIALILTPIPAILAAYIGIIDSSLLTIFIAFEIFAAIIGYALNQG